MGVMSFELIGMSFDLWAIAFAVGLVAGLIKGVVGFALPMVMISGLSTIMAPELALAGLILPALASNLWQAFRYGFNAVLMAIKRYRIFLSVTMVLLMLCAQLVPYLSQAGMLLLLGVPISLYACMTLLGYSLHIKGGLTFRTEVSFGVLAGFFGGVAGVWGPPTVAVLTAQNLDKNTQILVQGVVYGLGSTFLMFAHFGSGVLNEKTLPFSAFLCVPALLGIWIGFRIQDKIDQAVFRRLTLAVLLIAGLNLVRRGVLFL